MKIEVNVQAPDLVDAINNLATAMGSTPIKESHVKKKDAPAKIEEPAKQDESKEDEPKTFSRASYYHNADTGDYFAFKKGDEVPTDETFQAAKAISKKDYDKGIADQEEPEEKEDAAPSVEVVRAKTAEASKAGKRDEIKDLLAEFGVSAVSKIPEDQRAEYLEKLDEL